MDLRLSVMDAYRVVAATVGRIGRWVDRKATAGLPGRRRRRHLNPLWLARHILLFGTVSAVLAIGTLIQLSDLPSAEPGGMATTSYICGAEVLAGCGPGNATATFHLAGEDRELVTFSELPDHLVDAIVATEDRTFFSHVGFDPRGMLRAVYRLALGDAVTQGGSTLTQQYVKNAFDDRARNGTRKFREIGRAVRLEQALIDRCEAEGLPRSRARRCAKEQVLVGYLNSAYFGRGASGIRAASWAYFDVDVADLDVGQAAFLAGLLRNPFGAEPDTDPSEAIRRRDVSLDLMVRAGLLDEATAEAAAARPLGAVPASSRPGLGAIVGAEYGTGYVIEEVRIQVDQLFPDGGLYDGGLRVYTTLDHRRQRAAYTAAYGGGAVTGDTGFEVLPEMGPTALDPHGPDEPAAAIVTIDRAGLVVAMVAGTDFASSPYNLVTHRGGAGRAPEATMHLLGLVQQLSSSADPYEQIVLDGGEPRCVEGTSAARSHKVVSPVRDFLVGNDRAMADLMELTDRRALVDLGRRLGMSDRIDAALDLDDECGLILGRVPVSLLDVANLYSTVERGGKRLDPVLIERIENAAGEVLCWYPVAGDCAEGPEREATRVLDPDVAGITGDLLRETAASGGGRTAPPEGVVVAGTAATSPNNRDAWFVGSACEATTVVWVGFHEDRPRPMFDFRRDGAGVGYALDADGDPVDDPDWPDVEGDNVPRWIWDDYLAADPGAWSC